MISVQDASEIILGEALTPELETVPFQEAGKRVLAEDIYADSDLPSFDRVMMDGIAIRRADFESGVRSFEMQTTQQAGEAAIKLNESHCAIEIMTGAVLPEGADAIIPYEQLEIHGGTVLVKAEEVRDSQHIHKKGSDKLKGEILVERNTIITAAEIGVATSVGKTSLKVYKLPSIHIFSTGDELVEPNELPLAHQIRRSNVFAIQQLLKSCGFNSSGSHLPDTYEKIVSELKRVLLTADIILLTGGVSKGKFDLIPQALADCGVEQLFHRISQRPGKPMWFGSNGKTRVFALPGNPVSSFMCSVRYLLPFLRKSFNRQAIPDIFLKLSEDVKAHPTLSFFLQIRLKFDSEGVLWAVPFRGNGSGDFSNLTQVDGFVELPASTDVIAKGTAIRAFLFRDVF